jgi:uncharacterized membrane protein YfcA
MMGVGGGPIIVPILTLAFHLPIQVAIGSSLVAIVANTCTAAGIYTKAGLANLKLGVLLETATTPGAIIGGFAAAVIAPSILNILFGLVLLYVAYTMVTRRLPVTEDTTSAGNSVSTDSDSNRLSSELKSSYYDHAPGKVVTYKVNHLPVGLGGSFFAGVLSSLLGIGGGIIKVPIMNLVMGVPMKSAVATSTFMVAITATVGALIYQHNGYLYPTIIAPLAVGIVIGASAGAKLTQKIKGVLLRRIFGLFMFLVAVTIFLKAANII